MLDRFATIWREAPTDLKRRLIAIYAILIVFNGASWAAIFAATGRYPLLLAPAILAYGLGLRHAVDADHIAAIDNTTRKLMQDGKRPVGVGFFFSLGHSTVVLALTLLIVVSAGFVQKSMPQLKTVGGVVGTSVSGVFLVLIGAINLIVLIDIYKTWRQVVRGGAYNEESLDDYLNNRGLLARLFKPLLRAVSNSWNMYPIGFLFGLGFDTASEVAVLSIAAKAGANGMPVYLILLLPLIFAAGMCLADTTDGVLMLGAYGWAYIKPVRKLYYNLNITLISVLVALLIGGLELMQVLITETKASGGLWSYLGQIDISNMGFVIVGIFALSWIGSMLFYKLRRIDQLEDNFPKSPSGAMGRGR